MAIATGGPSGPPPYVDDPSGARLPVMHMRRPPVLCMEAGVNPVSPSTPDPGWVSGNPAGAAPGAAVSCVFDLGADWDQYGLAQVAIINSANPHAGIDVQISGSDSPGWFGPRRLNHAYVRTGSTLYERTPQATSQQVFVRPMGRFLNVMVVNADGAVSNGAGTKCSVTIYPTT